MLGKRDSFMSRDCAFTVLSDSLVYDSEMWNDSMSSLEALVRKCRHLCFCFVTSQYTMIVREKQTERVEGWRL